MDRWLSPHSIRLFASFSYRLFSFPLLILPSGVGRPRYLASKVVCVTCKILLIPSWISCRHAGLNKIEHICGLIICPVPLAYTSRTCFTLCACPTSALKNKSVSSAKSKCDIPGARRHTLRGVIVPCVASRYIIAERPSATNKNKNGDSGSPWRRPRVGENESSRVPLNFTE